MGPKDKQFQAATDNIFKNYVESSQNPKGEEFVKVTKKYLPNYMKECSRFFEPAIKTCARHAVNSPELTQCINTYEKEFEALLWIFWFKSDLVLGSLSNKSVPDLEKFKVNDAQKQLRKLAVDPFSILSH